MENNCIEYEEILSNILDKNISLCNCPKKYMRSTRLKKEGCRFDQFSQKCNYEGSKFTFSQECICMSNTDISIVTEPECICIGTCVRICNCNSSEMINPPSGRDDIICTCKSCHCQSIYSSSNSLPSYFRNAIIKNNHNQSVKYKSKRFCDIEKNKELKQLYEAQKQIKEEFNQINSKTNDMNGLQLQKTQSSKSLLQDSVQNAEMGLFDREDKAIDDKDRTVVPCPQNISKVKIQCKKSPLKAKLCKQNLHNNKKCNRRQMLKRYYYSGGTEHYGVKSGHKHCLGSTILFKNTEYVWKAVNNSSNKRGSVPPGYIRASVKHKIQVIKNANEKKADIKFSQHSLVGKSSVKKMGGIEDSECEEEPPLIHVHKKGRAYRITFCPKESDPDIKPVPIPFAFTNKKENSNSDSTESTLELELHSPKQYKMLEEKKTKACGEKTENLTALQIENLGACTTITTVNQTEELKQKEKNQLNPYKQLPNVEAAEALNDKKLKNEDKLNKLVSNSSTGPNLEVANGMKSKNKEKDKFNKLKSAGSQENKILWEEQQTHMQNRTS